MSSTFDLESEGLTPKKSKDTRCLIVVAVVVAVVAVGVGVLIGYFSHTEDCELPEGPCLGNSVPEKIIQEADDSIFPKLYDAINKENIRENLRLVLISVLRCMYMAICTFFVMRFEKILLEMICNFVSIRITEVRELY